MEKNMDYNIVHLNDEEKTNLMISLNRQGIHYKELSKIFKVSARDIVKFLKENDIYYKKCSNPECDEPIKHFTKFHSKSRDIDGCEPRCKNCNRKYQIKNKEKIKEYTQQWYIDNRNKVLEQSSQYYLNNMDKRKEYHRDNYQENRSDILEHQKQYYQDNRDERLEYSANYYIEHREELLKKMAEYYSDLENKKKQKASHKKYDKAHPEIKRHFAARRRAILLQATPKWADMKKICEIYKEARRLELEDGIQRHVDHIHALRGETFCGLHVPWNLQILTAVENRQKSNKLILG